MVHWSVASEKNDASVQRQLSHPAAVGDFLHLIKGAFSVSLEAEPFETGEERGREPELVSPPQHLV